MSDAIDFEKLSYGKSAYKRVQRLRRKGRGRGITVPYLAYELHKPEKPRIAFWIVAVVSTVLLIGIIVGIGFLYNELIKTISVFDGIGDVFKAVFDPSAFLLSSGLSALPAIMIALAYFLLIVMFLLPLGAILFLFRFVRETFYMAKCSKEEFAKGEIISSRILSLVVTLVCATVLFVVLLIYGSGANAKLLIGLIYGGIVIVIGSLLALIIVEKAKSKTWFENLEEDKKQNYLEHDRALRAVKRRLHFEKQFWNNLG